ncbi:sensor histidine kinase [Psychroflexus tropicus]|uniref:sensor histidine kinase n=1 Tax=Psychroflexus tropicus TaxID=197345 RepID=UPI00037D69FE|nr:sensor histidine kinase [Psychroflexus tropicus]
MFISLGAFAQTQKIDELFRYSKFKKLDTLLFQSKANQGLDVKLAKAKYFNSFKRLKESFALLFDIDTTAMSTNQKAHYHDNLASAYHLNGNFDRAAAHYITAQNYYKDAGDLLSYNSLNMDLYYIMFDPDVYNGNNSYLKAYHELALELNDPLQLVDLETELAYVCKTCTDTTDHFLKHIDKAYDYLKLDPSPQELSSIHFIKGMYYTNQKFLKDSAEYYFKKSLQIDESLGLTHKVAMVYFYIGDVSRIEGNYSKAIYWTKKANSYRNLNYDYDLTAFINETLAEDYKQINQLDSAYFYLSESLRFRDSLNYQKQNINLTRYEAEKKERENLRLEQENKQNQTYILGSLGALGLLMILSVSVYINSKRKRLLIEKDKALQIKGIENELKKQQLKALDALVMGQEKERMRIASDLHDNIGSNFVAMTAYFEQLKKELKSKPESSSIFNRTQQLLDDTYQDIRSIAHLKHSGQMKDRDLIPALEKLTKNVSSFSKIEVEFNSFIGHELELNDHLELNIFRIVQEAMANIVKHSKAKTASVSITNIESSLNIIIEDDGKGFDLQKVKAKGSLGLEGIQQRVDLLRGDFKIDTKKGRGTTLIIDIPL